MNEKLTKLIDELREMPPIIQNGGRRQFRVIARALDKKGRILSTKTNTYSTSHPQQKHYAALAGKPEAIYLHAEIATLLAARKDVHTLLIARINNSGEPVSAKPCEICKIAISEYGVKEIFHT